MRIDISTLKYLPVKLQPVALLEDLKALLKSPPPPPPPMAPDTVYATVKVGNKVVATLYNNGASVTSNLTYTKIKHLFSRTEAETSGGPELAQKRAEEIAKALGGTVELSGTAQSQGEWQSQAAANEAAATLYYAQLLGQDVPLGETLLLDEKSSYDFHHMTADELLKTVNSLIKARKMTVDESSALIGLMPPTELAKAAGVQTSSWEEPMDVFAKLRQQIAFNREMQNETGAVYGEKALAALLRLG